MSKEIGIAYTSQATVYFNVTNSGLYWNNASGTFNAFQSGQQANTGLSATEDGITGIYWGNFPAAIPPGQYGIIGRQQLGGAPADTDRNLGTQNYEWNGSKTLPRSDLATSGQIGILAPIRIFRGQMVQNFPFKMVSAADHVTPFVSGVISGQISRDGAAFTNLQSGNVTEIGHGWYQVPLTSGDLLANSVALIFTGNGISGGVCDQRDFGMILQRTSGQ